jgi:hypothetical protein
MKVRNNNLGKFLGPSASYMGYVFIACGIFASLYSLLALTLLIPGIFMTFTYDGILIDLDNKRLKPYTALFGLVKTGNWIEAGEFSRFSIVKSTKKYTSYSRGSVRFDMKVSDIELLLINRNGSKKIVLNKYNDFEEARKEMDIFRGILIADSLEVNEEIR